MALVLVTPPASEPVTLTEAKAHLRVDHDDDDTYIGTLITAARELAEKITRRAVMPQTWDLYLDTFEAGFSHRGYVLDLPKPRLQSVTSITYYDGAGAQQTWSSSEYVVHAEGDDGYVQPAAGYDFPSTDCDRLSAVKVRFVAGYADAASVPARIKMAILIGVGDLYAQRESIVTGTINSEVASLTMERLLSPYVCREFR